MKKILFMLITAIATISCESSNEFGECVGLLDEKDENLRYDYSIHNVIIGAVFSETIIVPGIILLKDLECPISRKGNQQPTIDSPK